MKAQATSHLGPVRLARKPEFTLVAATAAALLAGMLMFTWKAQVTRRAHVTGLLTPIGGPLDIAADGLGRVTDVPVQEGQHVPAGQPLVVIHSDRPTMAGDEATLATLALNQREAATRAEHAARASALRQREQGAEGRLQGLDAEISRAQQEAALAERRALLARSTSDRFQQLAQEGFVPKLQAQARLEEWIDQQMRLEAAQRTLAAQRRERVGLRSDLAELRDAQLAEAADRDRDLSTLEQERAGITARQQWVARAPGAGVVAALHVQRGHTVKSGQAVVTFIPDAEGPSHSSGAPVLQAILFARARDTGLLERGQAVWLHLSPYANEKFGATPGTVVSISKTPVSPQDLPSGHAQALLNAAQAAEPLYRITVALVRQTVVAYGQEKVLRPGSLVEADILVQRLKLWQWLLEPLLATRRHLVEGQAL